MFNIGLYSKNINILLSETTRSRAFLYGMKWYHVVELYQV